MHLSTEAQRPHDRVVQRAWWRARRGRVSIVVAVACILALCHHETSGDVWTRARPGPLEAQR